jgi:hypothetical protein
MKADVMARTFRQWRERTRISTDLPPQARNAMHARNRAVRRTVDGPNDPGRQTMGVPANNIAPLLRMTQSRPAGYFHSGGWQNLAGM